MIKLPTEQQCLDYFDEYKVPKNIFTHCLIVREVAVFLAKELSNKLKEQKTKQESGHGTEQKTEINVKFVSCLALLHDLFKVVAISELKPTKYHDYPFSEEEIVMWKSLRRKYPNMYEGEVAYLIFKDKFPELAKSLRDVSNPRNENPSWEELIVHYADWRVFQNNVVLLRDRLSYLQEMYPREDHVWDSYNKRILELEQKIMSIIQMKPEELKDKVQKELDQHKKTSHED